MGKYTSSVPVKLVILAAAVFAGVLIVYQGSIPGSTSATGNTITSPDTAGFVGDATSLALDASGYPVVSYRDFTNRDLKVLHCGDPACSSGNTITVPDTAGDVVDLFTSLTLDASGYPVVSYQDRTNEDLKVLHCGDPTCSSGNSITSPDTAGDVGHFPSLALDGNGNPVISYSDFTNTALKVLHCGDPACSSGNAITTPDTSAVNSGTSLALDTSGNPVVGYGGGDLRVLHCGDPTCSSGNSITAPDTAGDVGYSPSLALDASGNPVVSYRDLTNEDLKVLHCGDPTCSSGNTITAPDTVGAVGRWTSLAMDASGNPVVSYTDDTNGDLKVLHCGDPTCSSGNSITSPITVGPLPLSTSLALDTSGNPVVSHGGGDLEVLHCSDPTCAATKPPDTPAPVGGIAVDPELGGLALEAGATGDGMGAGVILAIAAGAVALGGGALGGAGWYARRRLGRR